MSFFLTLLVWVFTAVLGELLRPKVSQSSPKPAQLSDFNAPTATEDRAIPVIWGTVEISGPNVIWYGDLFVQPIEKSISTGFFSSQKIATGKYRYFIGQQFALCRGPIDAVLALRFDNYACWEGELSNGTVIINQSNLYGGEEKEGGFRAAVDVVPGDRTQVANAYVASVMRDVPGYCGVCCVVFRGPSSGLEIGETPSGYIGTNANLKQPKFTVKRVTIPEDQPRLNSGLSDIGGDMNPAEIIWELCTNSSWGGMGVPASLMDNASFLIAAQTLYDEGFGLSLIWDQAGTVEDQIALVLRHIDGVLYPDPESGKFVLTLARGDYDAESLEVFDESTIESVTNYSLAAWDETTNEVRVSYLERRYFKVKGTLNDPPANPVIGDQWLVGPNPTGAWTNHAGELATWGGASWAFSPAGGYQEGAPAAQYVFTSRVAAAQDLGNYQIQQQIVSGSASYPGISKAELAQRVAQRDLRTLTYPLVRCTVRLNRAGYNLRPGKVFRLNWSELGLSGLVLRVLKINYGTLEQGAIVVEVIEDIFSLGNLTYSAPAATSFSTPAVPVLEEPFTPTDAIAEAGAAIVELSNSLALLQTPALSITTTAPPASPTEGDKFIVPTGASGAWAGQTSRIAVWDGSAWVFLDPYVGLEQFVVDVGVYYSWDGAEWSPRASGGGGGPVAAEDVLLTPTGALLANDVQAAFAELDADLTAAVAALAEDIEALAAAAPYTQIFQFQTAAIAAGASLDVTIPMARRFELDRVESDAASRLFIYINAGSRAADSARSADVKPDPGSGLLFQGSFDYLGKPLAYNTSPVPDCVNRENPTTANMACKVTNLTNGTRTFTLTLTCWVQQP